MFESSLEFYGPGAFAEHISSPPSIGDFLPLAVAVLVSEDFLKVSCHRLWPVSRVVSALVTVLLLIHLPAWTFQSS